MQAKLTFLGTAFSLGIPVIGCKCSVCTSELAKNKRKRAACLLEFAGKKFLVDVGPDFREQALFHNIDTLDGLLLSHTHFDHIAGIDDLKVYVFKQKKPIPTLMSDSVFEDVKSRYHYLLNQGSEKLDPRIVSEGEDVFFEGLKLKVFFYEQQNMQVTGFRFKSLAYVTDIKTYSDDILKHVKGVDTLVISALDWEPTRAHIGIEEAVSFGKLCGAKKTYITHLGHGVDHEEISKKLPERVYLAFDGLSVDFEVEK